jgi:hypothetical protein
VLNAEARGSFTARGGAVEKDGTWRIKTKDGLDE